MDALNDLRPALPGVTVDTSFFTPATYVHDSLHNIALALVIAAVLGIVALGALLLDLRALFLSAISVALSLSTAVLALDALGYTLNTLIVVGLLVASAVVVDDAVGATMVLLGRVRLHREQRLGVPLQGLIVDGIAELRGTLGYATLIVLLAIVPVFFAKGLTATYLHPMALAFALAVIASALVVTILTPAMGIILFDRARTHAEAARLKHAVRARYAVLVQDAMRIPRGALLAVCLLGFAAAIAFPFLNQPSSPRFKDRNVVVTWTGPPGAGLQEMGRITSRVVTTLRGLPSVSDVAATLGRAVSGDRIVDTNSGQIYVEIKPGADYDRAYAAIRGIAGGVPGMQATVSTPEAITQNGVLEAPDKTFRVRIYGESYAELHALGTQIARLMGQLGGTGPAQISTPTVAPNINVAVDDAKAHNAGVLPGDARRQASTLVSGLTVGNFFEQQAVFDAVVWSVPSVRATLQDVRNLPIDTAGGQHVPLSRIASVTIGAHPVDIQHQGLSRYVEVSAPIDSGTVADARSKLQPKLSQVSFQQGYHAEFVGGTPNDPTSHLTFLSFALAALVGILLLLQAAFGSWRLACMYLLALPAALIGGVLVALITGQIRTLGADLGLLAVFAFAARQGVLQIVAIRRRHAADGGPLTAAIVSEAAGDRLGPSLTALLVSAATLIPFIVIGDVAGNEITHITAAVMLGGLLTATLLNQVLVPAMCLALGPREPLAGGVDPGPAELLDPTAIPAPPVSAS